MNDDEIAIHAALFDLVAGDVVSIANGTLTRVHPAANCSGEHCWVHNPSDSHMKTWPVAWDAHSRIAYRLCPEHRHPHPDLDDFRYRHRYSAKYSGWFENMYGKHECCPAECCLGPSD